MFSKAHRLAPQDGRIRSFTLVELLVAIFTISLLVAIMSPSLRSARQQAKEAVCASQLKQWGVAYECYAVENRGFWPHCDGLDRQDPDPGNPDIPPRGTPTKDLADWHGWVDVLPPMIDRKPWRHYGMYEHPKAKTFYQCPSARLADGGALYGYYPRIDGYFSYAMNACLELDENAWRPPDGTDYPMPSFLDTAKIVCPQRVVLLFDQLLDPRKGYGGSTLYRSAGKHCGSYPISFSARHQRGRSTLGGNLLFGDGHVDWQRTVWKPEWGEWVIGHQQGPPRNDRNWYPYPAAQNGTG